MYYGELTYEQLAVAKREREKMVVISKVNR